MTTQAKDEAREQFERKATDLGIILDNLRPGTGPGVRTLVLMAWDEAFEAGRLQGLEEAERINSALLEALKEFVRVMELPATTVSMPHTVKKAKAAIRLSEAAAIREKIG